ncbi:hypothetical protein EXU57_08275 [Segetibacter sp. 3557_3]|uniref:hypothetical protein n=1 Tax=Segetibacter sp. 3557_3 TaxID=2547429 RepID=UPI0010587DE2|nr:hypothetical protein [Segetibacter sp. 3557_3]TDH26798.1 hypothetical protein EXU57_08275 [Segetibacter sp. 3557_3]
MARAFCLLIIVAACSYTIPAGKPDLQMAGAYRMLTQVFTRGEQDTSYDAAKQLKIYTPQHMMYANILPGGADTFSSFGVGRYSIKDGKVIEDIFYSGSDTSVNSTTRSYTLDITKSAKGYKQVIDAIGTSNGQKLKLTETYEQIGSAQKSPVDGTWKLVKVYSVSGKDTTDSKVTQYKTYYAGHFIWGRTALNDAGKNETAVGFGSFEMNGQQKLRETVFASTYSVLNGQTVAIDIKMNGTDSYIQSFNVSDNEVHTEVYSRLK